MIISLIMRMDRASAPVKRLMSRSTASLT